MNNKIIEKDVEVKNLKKVQNEMIISENQNAEIILNILEQDNILELEIKSSIDTLTEQKPELKEILNSMSVSIEDSSNKIESLLKTKLLDKINNLDSSLKILYDALNTKNDFIINLLNLIVSLKDQDVNNKKIHSDSQKSINEVKLENQMQKGHIKSLTNKIEHIEKQIDIISNEKLMLVQKLKDLEEINNSLEDKLKETNKSINKNSNIINELTKDNSEKRSIITDLNDKIANYLRDIESKNLKIYENEEQFLKVIDKLRHEELNIQEVKNELTISEKKILEKQEFMNKLQEKLLQYEDQNKNLQNKVDEYYFELENLKVKMRKHIENEEVLNEKLKDYEKKRAKLVEEKEVIGVEIRELEKTNYMLSASLSNANKLVENKNSLIERMLSDTSVFIDNPSGKYKGDISAIQSRPFLKDNINLLNDLENNSNNNSNDIINENNNEYYCKTVEDIYNNDNEENVLSHNIAKKSSLIIDNNLQSNSNRYSELAYLGKIERDSNNTSKLNINSQNYEIDHVIDYFEILIDLNNTLVNNFDSDQQVRITELEKEINLLNESNENFVNQIHELIEIKNSYENNEVIIQERLDQLYQELQLKIEENSALLNELDYYKLLIEENRNNIKCLNEGDEKLMSNSESEFNVKSTRRQKSLMQDINQILTESKMKTIDEDEPNTELEQRPSIKSKRQTTNMLYKNTFAEGNNYYSGAQENIDGNALKEADIEEYSIHSISDGEEEEKENGNKKGTATRIKHITKASYTLTAELKQRINELNREVEIYAIELEKITNDNKNLISFNESLEASLKTTQEEFDKLKHKEIDVSCDFNF